jgi:Ran GTPase-activating protein (RanGAP) involved in mRNA processing and transport
MIKDGCVFVYDQKVSFADVLHLKNLMQTNSVLHLDKVRLDSIAVIYLCQGLAFSQSILELHLGDNGFGDHGLLVLARTMREHIFPLKSLSITNNDIHDQGINTFVSALVASPHSQITEISFADNDIRDQGVAAFAFALEKGVKIQSLNVSDNEIADVGAKRFARALKNNTCLCKLNISRNLFNLKGFCALGRAVAKNSNLETLYWFHPKIPFEKRFRYISQNYSITAGTDMLMLAHIYERNKIIQKKKLKFQIFFIK